MNPKVKITISIVLGVLIIGFWLLLYINQSKSNSNNPYATRSNTDEVFRNLNASK